MNGKKLDPNAELIGRGLGNIFVPFFAASPRRALSRGRRPISSGSALAHRGGVHRSWALAILLLAPAVAYVPMAALAALLLLVAWNMSEAMHSSTRCVSRRERRARAPQLLRAHGRLRHGDRVSSRGSRAMLFMRAWRRRHTASSWATPRCEARWPRTECSCTNRRPRFFARADRVGALDHVGRARRWSCSRSEGARHRRDGLVALESTLRGSRTPRRGRPRGAAPRAGYGLREGTSPHHESRSRKTSTWRSPSAPSPPRVKGTLRTSRFT